MKKLVSVLLSCLMIFSLFGFKNISASEYDETIYIFDDYEVEEYFYENVLNEWKPILFHSPSCFPGDPGYPVCGDLKGAKFTTKKLYSEEKELENNVNLIRWIYGGEYGGSMSYSDEMSLSYNFEGYSFTTSVSGTYTFNVPPRKNGTIRYRARIRVTYYSYEIAFETGGVKTGRYQKVENLKTGTFYPYFE